MVDPGKVEKEGGVVAIKLLALTNFFPRSVSALWSRQKSSV